MTTPMLPPRTYGTLDGPTETGCGYVQLWIVLPSGHGAAVRIGASVHTVHEFLAGRLDLTDVLRSEDASRRVLNKLRTTME